MSDPCQQVGRLETIDDKIDKIADLLTTVAVQKKEIEHIVETLGELKKCINELFERIRVLETRPAEHASKFIWIIVAACISAGFSAAFTLAVTSPVAK